MPINTSFAEAPAWLKTGPARSDPQSFGQYLEARKLADQEQEQADKSAREDALFPLQKIAAEQQLQQGAANLQKSIDANQFQTQVRQGEAALGRAMVNFKPNDPSTWGGFTSVLDEHPQVVSSPMFDKMLGLAMTTSERWETAKAKVLEQQEAAKTPEMKNSAALAKFDNDIADARASNDGKRMGLLINQRQRLEESLDSKTKEKQSPGALAADDILKAQSELRAAQDAGDADAINAATQKIELLKDAFPARQNEEIQIGYDDQGKPVFSIRKGATAKSGPTVGTLSKSQQEILQHQKSIGFLNDLQSSLNPGDVGLRGVVGEKVLDKMLPQLGYNTASISRMDNRTKLKALTESMLREMTTDNRLSQADRKAVTDILPSVGLMESYPNAMQVMDVLKEMTIKRIRFAAKAGNEPIPDTAMTADELIAAKKAGTLTPERAQQLFRMLPRTLRNLGQ